MGKYKIFSEKISHGSSFKVFGNSGKSSGSKPTTLEIQRSRRRVIEGMLKGNDPVDICNILLTEPNSDWTTNEILQHMKSLGVPEDQLNRVRHVGRT